MIDAVGTICMWKCPACGDEMLADGQHGHLILHALGDMTQRQQMKALESDQRRAFIRNHASRLEAAYVCGLMSDGRAPTAPNPEDTWKLARGLWDAKPEDC